MKLKHKHNHTRTSIANKLYRTQTKTLKKHSYLSTQFLSFIAMSIFS